MKKIGKVMLLLLPIAVFLTACSPTALHNDASLSDASQTAPPSDPAPVLVSEVRIEGTETAWVGETVTLTATVLPNEATEQSVSWSLVPVTPFATITQDGQLRSTIVGPLTVRAVAQDGSGVFAEHTVTFNIVPVTEICVHGNTRMKVGESQQLTATVLPENATYQGVAWTKFADPGQVSLTMDGKLTAREAGTVIIRAYATDNTQVYGDLVVRITGKEVKATDLVITGDATMKVGDTQKLSVSFVPQDTTYQEVDWSIATGKACATVRYDGTVTATKAGTVKVRVRWRQDPQLYRDFVIQVKE